jgi:hypothetical protein
MWWEAWKKENEGKYEILKDAFSKTYDVKKDGNTVFVFDYGRNKIFTNEDGSTGILYLISNDLSIDADRIYEVYQKRWKIGVSRFRTLYLVGESPIGVKDSSPVAWEASWRESKAMEPSDNIFRKEYVQYIRP